MKKHKQIATLFFAVCALNIIDVKAAEPTIHLDHKYPIDTTNKEGINIGGKRAEEAFISKSIKLEAGKDADPVMIGAIMKKNQRALFEAELQSRDSWNNSNSYNCSVKNKLSGKSLFGMSLDAISYNDSGTNKTTGSALKTTGAYRWAVYPPSGEGAFVMFEVTCRGYSYGYPPNLVLHLKKVVFE